MIGLRKRSIGMTVKLALCALIGATVWSGISPGKSDAAAVSIPGVAAGAQHSAALLPDGTFWVWGENNENQLGIGAPSVAQRTPVMKELSGITSIAVGHDHSLVVNKKGELFGFGANWSGQLGKPYSVATTIASPTQISTPGGTGKVTVAAAGQNFSLALKDDGTAWIWGYSSHINYVNRGTSVQHIPYKITGTSWQYTGAAAALDSGFLITNNKEVYAFGRNDQGQLGVGSYRDQTTLSYVRGLNNIKDVATSGTHTLAVTHDGNVLAFGSNEFGKLGLNSDTASFNKPQPVPGLSDIQAIAVGSSHSVALDGSGHVYLWGSNEFGQLGNGTKASSSTPIELGLDHVISIAAGFDHTLLMQSDGSVWACGTNSFGQVGVGTASEYLTPVKVFDLPPTAPADFRAMGEAPTSVQLNWKANTESDFHHYNVYWRRAGSPPETPWEVRETTDTGYKVTGLESYKYYDFKVTAVDAAGHESQPTETLDRSPVLRLPDVPPAYHY